MPKMTKRIRLVLLSSSLALAGCGQGGGKPVAGQGAGQPACVPNPEAQAKAEAEDPWGEAPLPPVCGPVDGQHAQVQHHNRWFPWLWFWGGSSSSASHSGLVAPAPGVRSGTGSSPSKPSSVGTTRGGFGASGVGASS